MTASVVRRIDVYFENTEEFHTDTCVDIRAGNFSSIRHCRYRKYGIFTIRFSTGTVCERCTFRNIKRELRKPPA